MKVPSPTQGNTKPSAVGMDYLRPAVPDFSGLISGLSSLGAAFERSSAEAKAEQDRTDRFKMLVQVNEFQQGASDLSLQTQKNTAVDAANHVETATSSYVNYANKFLEQVDPKFQEEFKLQISNTGQKFGIDARAFQETQQKTYFDGQIDKAAEWAKLQVANDPSTMEEHNKKLRDMIIHIPGWSPMQRAEALHANDMALKGIVYGKEVQKQLLQNLDIPKQNEFLSSRGVGDQASPERIESLNPAFKARLAKAIAAAEQATGEKASIRSATRTHGEQALARARYESGQAGIAAKPGRSRHEFGLAVDVNEGKVLTWLTEHANEYGLEFLRPELNDPGHIQMPGKIDADRPEMGVKGFTFADLSNAVRGTESDHGANVLSPKGAAGDMQVMPGTAREIAAELKDANFPVNGTDEEVQQYLISTEAGQTYGDFYLKKMLKRFDNDPEVALIAYNGGPGRANDFLKSGRDYTVLPKETQDYVGKVYGRLGVPDNIDDNPRYAGLPYETRVKLREAGETSVNQWITEQHKQKVAAQAEYYDNFYKGVVGNLSGYDQNQADEALQLGELTPEDHSKLTTLINKKAGDATDAQIGADKYASGSLWLPEDQKYANAFVVGDAGKAAIQNADEKYFKTLLAFTQKSHLIPSEALNSFEALLRSNNPKQQLSAIDALSQLKQAEGPAFEGQATESMKHKVDFYESAMSAGMDAKFISEWLSERVSPEEATYRAWAEKEADRVLALKEDSKDYDASLNFDKVAPLFDPGLFSGDPELPASPKARLTMELDWKFLLKENFIKTRDWKVATELTTAQIKRVWGVAVIGEKEILMKWPPHLVNPQLANRMGLEEFYKNYETQAISELKLPPGTKFQVISTERTPQEMAALQEFNLRGPEIAARQLLHDNLPFIGPFVNVPKLPPSPGHTVIYYDPVQLVWREARDEQGRVQRFHFAFTPKMAENEAMKFEYEKVQRKAFEAEAEVNRGRTRLGEIGKPALDELKEKARIAREAADAMKPPPTPEVQGPEQPREIQQGLKQTWRKQAPAIETLTPLEGYPAPIEGMVDTGNLGLDKTSFPAKDTPHETMIIEEQGNFVIIPMITMEGDVLDEKAALHYYDVAAGHFGKFNSREKAEEYAKKLGYK